MRIPDVAQAAADMVQSQATASTGAPFGVRARRLFAAGPLLLALYVALFAWRWAQGGGVSAGLRGMGFTDLSFGILNAVTFVPPIFETAYLLVRTRGESAPSRIKSRLDRLHEAMPYLLLTTFTLRLFLEENRVDLAVTSPIGADFTPWIYAVEGNTVAGIQAALRSSVLDWSMPFVYVQLYGVMHLLATVGFAAVDRPLMLRRVTFTWVAIYLIAIPFYLLVPVSEVWAYGQSSGRFQAVPLLAGHGIGVSHAVASVNNCFPSLHNAFAWALPFILWRSGWRKSGHVAGIYAALVTFSTIYLGVHWLTDIAAGVALAAVVTWAAVRVDFSVSSRLAVSFGRADRRPGGQSVAEATPDT